MYDIVILGAGPGGLTAAMYGARSGYSTLVIEKDFIGGQAALTNEIENFPGVKSTSGYELIKVMSEQVSELGVEVKYGEAEIISMDQDIKKIKVSNEIIEARTLIIALGAKPRKLGIAKEVELTGRGISYCAICDGNFYRGKKVAVIGGGNTAIEDAIYLSNIASEVFLIHRRDNFRATKILSDKINTNKIIKFIKNSVVESFEGDDHIVGLNLKNVVDGSVENISVDGIFVAIGNLPNTENLSLEKNEKNYIITNDKMETNIKGVYACGDIRNTPLKQIVTATGDGAIAANSAIEFLMENS